MNIRIYYKILAFSLLMFICKGASAQADTAQYLTEIKKELIKTWPNNRTINLVFHGHSVPTGYFRTPEIRTFESYPYLLLKQLKSQYPNASINVIITSIGGENSEQGQKRFESDVLVHKPDILFIDYALNDRNIGLQKSETALESMIKKALAGKIKIILMTPSPDLTVDLTKADNELGKYTNLIFELAKKYNIGLADSYGCFKNLLMNGTDLKPYMAQSNHPNEKGHQLIAGEIMKYFK